MKTRIKPMVSWSIWAGGLSLVMGLVTHEHLVKGFQTDKTYMSAVIAAVFVAGLIISFIAARQLHSEWKILKKIVATGTIPGSKRETDMAALFGKLAAYKEEGKTVDIHAAIDTYHSKHNSRARSVSIMAAMVISIGLLGTVVGLIMSISGLSIMVENVGLSRTMMMEALKTTVAGMGTAFYTTYFGALFGLILRAVAVSQLNALSELCAEATEYAGVHLTASLESKNEELNKQVSKVIESFGGMQKEIESITVRLSASFETTMRSFGESLAVAGSHALAATKECITGMTGQMAVFGNEIGAAVGCFNASIEKAGEEVLVSVGQVGSTIELSGEELRGAIGTVNTSIEMSGKELQAAFGGLNQMIAAAGEGVGESFGGLNSSVRESSNTVSGSLADLKLGVDGTTVELQEAIGKLQAAIGEASGEMKTLSKARLDADATEIAGHLALAADSIHQFLSKKNNREENQRVA